MSPLGWILFAGCCVVSGTVGWGLRSLHVEREQYRRDAERDARWDREHGIGGS